MPSSTPRKSRGCSNSEGCTPVQRQRQRHREIRSGERRRKAGKIVQVADVERQPQNRHGGYRQLQQRPGREPPIDTAATAEAPRALPNSCFRCSRLLELRREKIVGASGGPRKVGKVEAS